MDKTGKCVLKKTAGRDKKKWSKECSHAEIPVAVKVKHVVLRENKTSTRAKHFINVWSPGTEEPYKN